MVIPHMIRVIGLSCTAFFLSACSESPVARTQLSEQEMKDLTTRGDEISGALIKNLGGRLKAALAGGDVLNAVQVCQSMAQPLTEHTSDEAAGATVSRISLKTRNPVNAPADSYDSDLLAKWDKQDVIPASEIVQAADGTTRYYRPLPVQEVCVKCHGPTESLQPELVSLLDKLYPEDKARGYKPGDLRGAIKVVFE